MLPKTTFPRFLTAVSVVPMMLSSASAQPAAPIAPARPAAQPAAKPALTTKPNVLFIISDDLNIDLGCYGNPIVKTPNLDRLASRGVRFSQAYCQYPLCNPSRTSLVSGLRPDTTGVVGNNETLHGVVWMPEYFGQNNYFTARIGKVEHGGDGTPEVRMINWGLQEKPPQGGNAPLMLRDFWEAAKAGKNPVWKQPQQIVEFRATNHRDEDESDGQTSRRIVQLMEQAQKAQQAAKSGGAQPFFLAAGLYRPHLPFTAPQKYFDLYPPEKIVLPKETEPVGDRDDIPPIAFTKTGEAERMSDMDKKRTVAAYYACISFMDAQVGVMLDGLDRLGMRDNTVIVFMGDHGFHLGEHAGRGGDLGLWRKQTLFKESAQAPLIVSVPPALMPGVQAGSESKSLVEYVDIYPTLINLCGLAPRGELDGISFAPLLTEPNRAWKLAAFTQVTRGSVMGRSVQTARYRYTEWGNPQTAELYDHQVDAHEYRNLINDPAAAQTLAQMRALFKGGPNAALPAGVTRPDTHGYPKTKMGGGD